jgi:hypothetical protein
MHKKRAVGKGPYLYTTYGPVPLAVKRVREPAQRWSCMTILWILVITTIVVSLWGG